MGRQASRRGAAAGDSSLKIAVTGASGYIGRHVVSELERRGFPAMLIVREPPAGLSPRNNFVRLDIKDPPRGLYRSIGEPDTLIHLAWDGLPNYKSAHHLRDELPAQSRFLERLVDEGLRNLVVAGTCLEYGMQSGSLAESLETEPSNPYAIAKDTLRKQLQRLQSVSPFNLTWARLFYSYGEGQSPNSLLPQLRGAVERGEKTFKMSGGEQLRDYLPASTVAQHLVALAATPKDVGIVNVCSGKPVAVRALVESWINENGWSIVPDLGHYPYPDYEPMAFWGDRTKLDRCLATP